MRQSYRTTCARDSPNVEGRLETWGKEARKQGTYALLCQELDVGGFQKCKPSPKKGGVDVQHRRAAQSTQLTWLVVSFAKARSAAGRRPGGYAQAAEGCRSHGLAGS
mmetsp:Transcript_10508/g.31036  ORF Transcript_10508/g.31036 Transcript_10508/m.31036 type:complete len:107 (-) Transcript_10508:1516-1836(-)